MMQILLSVLASLRPSFALNVVICANMKGKLHIAKTVMLSKTKISRSLSVIDNRLPDVCEKQIFVGLYSGGLIRE
jgi:hypothetical protein